jgi:hypothetical protein
MQNPSIKPEESIFPLITEYCVMAVRVSKLLEIVLPRDEL